jgi:hypothetical protein
MDLIRLDSVKQMIDATGIERRCTTNDAVHFITLAEQKLGQIGAVLSGNFR